MQGHGAPCPKTKEGDERKMNKSFKNVAAGLYICNLKNIKNKINERDICINASNFDIKIENDEDIKTGRRSRRPGCKK